LGGEEVSWEDIIKNRPEGLGNPDFDEDDEEVVEVMNQVIHHLLALREEMVAGRIDKSIEFLDAMVQGLRNEGATA